MEKGQNSEVQWRPGLRDALIPLPYPLMLTSLFPSSELHSSSASLTFSYSVSLFSPLPLSFLLSLSHSINLCIFLSNSLFLCLFHPSSLSPCFFPYLYFSVTLHVCLSVFVSVSFHLSFSCPSFLHPFLPHFPPFISLLLHTHSSTSEFLKLTVAA